MKKVLVLAALATLVSTSAFATIAGSKHDMTNAAGAANMVTGTTETCVFCHTPHAANTTVTLAPLWNRDVVNATGTIYQGVSLNMPTPATLATINATDAPLCLSCHDGVVGNSLQNPPNGATLVATATVMNANATITNSTGVDLSNDHPVGMALGANPEGADNEIKSIAVISGGGTGFGVNPFYGATNIMWCSSCHDVHGAVAGTPFLRKSNAASALCLACHTK